MNRSLLKNVHMHCIVFEIERAINIPCNNIINCIQTNIMESISFYFFEVAPWVLNDVILIKTISEK